MQAVGEDENYFEGKQITADSNYHSYTSLALCKAEGLDAYIPDIQFRKRDSALPDSKDSKMDPSRQQSQSKKTGKKAFYQSRFLL